VPLRTDGCNQLPPSPVLVVNVQFSALAGLTTNGQHLKETARESFYKYLLLLAADQEETAASLRRKAEEFRCPERG
jgi:hypothetical protein